MRSLAVRSTARLNVAPTMCLSLSLSLSPPHPHVVLSLPPSLSYPFSFIRLRPHPTGGLGVVCRADLGVAWGSSLVSTREEDHSSAPEKKGVGGSEGMLESKGGPKLENPGGI
jgi:hypothetical protein